MDRLLSAMTPSAGGNQGNDSATADEHLISTTSIIDMFFPGFSVISSVLKNSLGIDLTIYIPLLLLGGGLTFAWNYVASYFWDLAETYLMASAEIRPDDELYYQVLGWVAHQRFAQRSRRFIANSNITGSFWWLWDYNDDKTDDEDYEKTEDGFVLAGKKNPLTYTPSFGSHSFWYKGHLLRFTRTQNNQQGGFLMKSEREEISLSCFGRNSDILKDLLLEARRDHLRKDEQKTAIYRGTTRTNGGGEAMWQRSMARTPRPFSTVILDEKVKKELISDMEDYLDPTTRRWYSNRGIPYRRGYLLYGPPGTGKSSLSLALAGYFKMRIYMVSLNSAAGSEESLGCLFAELPKRCVVLLEDIDTAGLTHTREEDAPASSDVNESVGNASSPPNKPSSNNDNNKNNSRLSLSGLLNILDGVASQEGRILIMTTNHLEKLDKALIRPGRVDMTIKFQLSNKNISASIFRAIFAPIEGDDKPVVLPSSVQTVKEKAKRDEENKKRAEVVKRIANLAEDFAAKIPEYEFSPAELQGYLLKHKRDPDYVVEHAEEWIEKTREEKREADKKKRMEEEKKKKEEEEKKKKEEEEEKKKKEDEEKKKKKKARRAKRRAKAKKAKKSMKSKSSGDDDSGSDSDSDSGSAASSSDGSDSESEAEKSKSKMSKKLAQKSSQALKDAEVPGSEAKKTGTESQLGEGHEASADDKAETATETTAKLPEQALPLPVEDHKRGKSSDSGYGSPIAD